MNMRLLVLLSLVYITQQTATEYDYEAESHYVSLVEANYTYIGLGLDAEKVAIYNLTSNETCTEDSVAECGEVCHCIEGKQYCCRQRQSWTALSHEEKMRVLTTIYNIHMGNEGQELQNLYYEIVHTHEVNFLLSIHNKKVHRL